MPRAAKGYIEQLPSGSFRVTVYVGTDPLTGRAIRLKATAKTEQQRSFRAYSGLWKLHDDPARTLQGMVRVRSGQARPLPDLTHGFPQFTRYSAACDQATTELADLIKARIG